MRALLPELKKETEVLLDEISYFNNLQTQASEQKRLMTAASQNMLWQRHDLDQLIQARQGRLQKTKTERDRIEKQLKELASEAQNLKQLMEKIASSNWDKKIGATKKAPRLRAGLLAPAIGKVIRGFGDKDEFGVASEGIMYDALAGSPVIAPQSGRVVFVGPFQGYGNIVIMQHDGGNHSFLAGLGKIDADVGQTVAAGEPLGIMPAEEDTKTASLYFEWRHNKKPIDPAL
jgi:septal ring factor EnvC (AmiA/AmiB activator)